MYGDKRHYKSNGNTGHSDQGTDISFRIFQGDAEDRRLC